MHTHAPVDQGSLRYAVLSPVHEPVNFCHPGASQISTCGLISSGPIVNRLDLPRLKFSLENPLNLSGVAVVAVKRAISRNGCDIWRRIMRVIPILSITPLSLGIDRSFSKIVHHAAYKPHKE